jgi:4-amino-4-deoxy-L-arabinose transferase-like glycosyltransferase
VVHQISTGWPAVLALASAAGMASAVNVLLGALTLGLVWAMARQVYSEREARLALFLMLFSPYFFGNCLGAMSHPLCGFLLAAATCCYFHAARTGSGWAAAGMLAGVGAATLVRPLTAAMFGAILGGAILWRARHERARMARTAALCGVFGLLTLAANGAYNRAATGNYAMLPYAMIEGGWARSAKLVDVAAMARNLRWGPMSTWVFAFPLLIPAAGWALWRDREKRAEAMLLAALLLSLVAGYAADGTRRTVL